MNVVDELIVNEVGVKNKVTMVNAITEFWEDIERDWMGEECERCETQTRQGCTLSQCLLPCLECILTNLWPERY